MSTRSSSSTRPRRSKPEPGRLSLRDLNRATLARQLLLDGRVAGTWTMERVKTRATLTLAPFGKLTKAVISALAAEGEALLRFVDPDATTLVVR